MDPLARIEGPKYKFKAGNFRAIRNIYLTTSET